MRIFPESKGKSQKIGRLQTLIDAISYFEVDGRFCELSSLHSRIEATVLFIVRVVQTVVLENVFLCPLRLPSRLFGRKNGENDNFTHDQQQQVALLLRRRCKHRLPKRTPFSPVLFCGRSALCHEWCAPEDGSCYLRFSHLREEHGAAARRASSCSEDSFSKAGITAACHRAEKAQTPQSAGESAGNAAGKKGDGLGDFWEQSSFSRHSSQHSFRHFFPCHLRPVTIKPVGRIFEISDSNPIRRKRGKCGRPLSPYKNKGLRRLHRPKKRKTRKMRKMRTRKRGKCGKCVVLM